MSFYEPEDFARSFHSESKLENVNIKSIAFPISICNGWSLYRIYTKQETCIWKLLYPIAFHNEDFSGDHHTHHFMNVLNSRRLSIRYQGLFKKYWSNKWNYRKINCYKIDLQQTKLKRKELLHSLRIELAYKLKYW